ncbi:hypothetical protein GYMLUDRAFT_44078 [Collybiopsis luxurians FD-317 M1]|uniref:Uncharacterized protein n=1 Tax=Collybiopsis luxurians FD-317 M1 TaxID=944289 RepID=A0A0D0CUU3_9AGAR|nr:hypothetical protein GYMLUDRAFT_44078 [Collybiopsis luxurians FD-317 M1]
MLNAAIQTFGVMSISVTLLLSLRRMVLNRLDVPGYGRPIITISEAVEPAVHCRGERSVEAHKDVDCQ